MDIEKFFDHVEHEWVMKFLKVRIADPNILRMIGRFLRAGVMEDGRYHRVDKGTPQGGILSPLLANIYLHYCLDIWFEKRVKRQLRGYARLIRYADDFVVCLQKAEEAIRERLGKFGLAVSEEKSRIISFGRYPYHASRKHGKKLPTFDFLGFTHYCTRTRRGYFRLGRKTAKEKLRERLKETNQWLPPRVGDYITEKPYAGNLHVRFCEGHYSERRLRCLLDKNKFFLFYHPSFCWDSQLIKSLNGKGK